jgi:two-component system sensor histidine kinase DesK
MAEAVHAPSLWMGESPRWRPVFIASALVFVAYPATALLTLDLSPVDRVLATAAVLMFVAVLAIGWRARAHGTAIDRTSRFSAMFWLAQTAIAGVLVLRDPHLGWVALFYFASTSASRLLPERRAQLAVAVTGIVSAGCIAWSTSDVGGALIQGFSIAMIGFLIYSVGALQRTNRALEEARHELARLAVADERSRIARDLHDTLGHSLSLITLKSELAGRLLPDDPARARSEIADVERVAREAMTAVRETIGGFRQPTLSAELSGVTDALRTAGIDVRFETEELPLAPVADALIAWTVREGVTNVMRHSGATRCTIRIGQTDTEVFAEIVDDGAGGGRGLASDGGEPVGAAGEAGSGFGLRGLAERVSSLGGAVVAGPLPDRGYRLRVTLPGSVAG